MYKLLAEKLYNVEDERIITKRGTYWNLISSLLNSAMTAIIMFFITLTSDVSVNGWFSIATAVAYQCQAIGFFGIRNLHIADTNKEYAFSDYAYFNFISSILMVFVLSVLSFGQSYVLEKACLIFIYGIYRGVDIFEALFHDEYQREGRLDLGVILQTIRFAVSLIVLIIVLLIFGNLVFATLAATLVSVLLIIIQNKPFIKYFPCKLKKIKTINLKKLFVICLPIFIAGFINMYLANAPKYAIDGTLSDELQGIFGILSLPIFTINLLSTVIYKPYISKMATYWYAHNFSAFKKVIFRQILIIVLLTFSIVTFGYLAGLRLLELIYGINLYDYMSTFILLLIGGGINTLGAFLNFIMVIFREQNKNMYIYILSGVITYVLGGILIEHFNLLGSGMIYILSSGIVTCLCCLVLFMKYHSVRRKITYA